MVAKDNAKKSKVEVGRDGVWAVAGLLALAVETLVHLNGENCVDDDFESAEADGTDGNVWKIEVLKTPNQHIFVYIWRNRGSLFLQM